MKMRFAKKVLTIALTATMALGTVACGSAADTKESTATSATATAGVSQTEEGAEGPSGQVKESISFALNSAPPSLDAQKTSSTMAILVGEGYIYERLLSYDGNYEIYPELAESYTVSDDNKEYTYSLRQGVKFHNGQEMTADDVVASMNRWIENVSMAGAVFGDSRFEKVDDYTVKVTLAAPNIYVNDTIAGCSNAAVIYPASVIEGEDASTGLIQEYIGTGPYKFVEWVPDQYILLQKNEDYVPYETGAVGGYAAPKEAVTEKIYFRFVPDDATRVAGIQTGEYDFIYKAPYDEYDLLNNDSNLSIYNAVYGDLWMVFNKKEGIGTNEKLRQAVQLALNDEEIMMGAYSNPVFYRMNGSYMLEEQSNWYNSEADSTYNQQNTEEAKKLLAESGYNGETFTILVSTDYTDMYNAALIIQAELKEIGINCELLTADWATFTSYRKDETMYTAFISNGGINAVPTTLLYLSTGFAGWATDEKLQSMMTELNSVSTLEEGVAKWKEIQSYCSTEYVPICKMGDVYRYSVAAKDLKGIGMFRFGPNLWNAYIEE